jgi:polar amino acid transport system substrate-binding protein
MKTPLIVRCATLTAISLLVLACGSPAPSTGGSATPTPAATGLAPPSILQAGQITFGSDLTYPPQDGQTNGTASGFDIEIGNALAAKLGLTPQWVNTAFNGIIPALQASRFDAIISAMNVTPDRSAAIYQIPYFRAGQSIMVKAGNPKGVKGLADLCGLTVAVQLGTTEETLLRAQLAKCPATAPLNLLTFQNDTDANLQLQNGRADSYMGDDPIAANYAATQPSEMVAVAGLQSLPEGIGVRKNDAALQDALKHALDQIIADGTYLQILTKYQVTAGDITKSGAGA